MPELPEVETLVNDLRESGLIGLKINEACVFWERTLSHQNAEEFCQRIKHQRILDIARRGKWIVITLDNDFLFIHLRMTGKFLVNFDKDETEKHERICLTLSDGRSLHYLDQRKFGKWVISTSGDFLKDLGTEPLAADFTPAYFKSLLLNNHSQIKPFLLNQKIIAGIGNIYADEALWLAKIHPSRRVNRLTKKEIAALHQAIIEVLSLGIKNTGTTLGATDANYFSVGGRRGKHQHQLNVFRKNGLPCPRCNSMIQKISLAQRGTHFCPTCQK